MALLARRGGQTGGTAVNNDVISTRVMIMRNNVDAGDPNRQAGVDDDGKSAKPQTRIHFPAKRVACLLLLGVGLVLIHIVVGGFNQPGEIQGRTSPGKTLVATEKKEDVGNPAFSSALNRVALERASAHAKYENCSVSFTPPVNPRAQSDWLKPFWVPSYASSGSANPTKKGDLVKQLTDSLIGRGSATKNYHMSMRKGKLKRCYGISETAACSMGHPIVPVKPETQTKNFQSRVILVVRNFLTAFPAGHTDKHIAYHNGQGQAPERNWRENRDNYLQGSMKSWREVIRYWTAPPEKNDHGGYYQVGLALPYEWMLDPSRGPALVQNLSDLYREAGFEVPSSSSDISCIWYNMASAEWKRQATVMQSDYIPGYTVEQQSYMIQQLQEEFSEHSNDLLWQQLLQEYIDQIQIETRIDIPATDAAR